MWTIVPQEEGEDQVLCKHIRFFPIKSKKTREVKFGRLNILVLKIVFRHESGDTHSLTMSDSGNGPKLKWHNPSYLEFPPLRDVATGRPIKRRGRIVPDVLSAKVRVEGQTFEMDADKLERKLGKDMAERTMALFNEKLFFVNTAAA